MQAELSKWLSKYFSLHGKVNLPGLGVLSVVRIPSTNDFANKLFYPPLYRFRFENNLTAPEESLMQYLKKKLSLSNEQLHELLSKFADDMLAQLNNHGKLEWEGIGRFSMDEMNVVQFTPSDNQRGFLEEVKYEHVIRDQFTHDVLTGDKIQSSDELHTYFEEQRRRKFLSQWKIASLVFLLLFIGLLIARFMLGNFSILESRHDRIHPKDAASTYVLKN
jgi:hypothetical protein